MGETSGSILVGIRFSVPWEPGQDCAYRRAGVADDNGSKRCKHYSSQFCITSSFRNLGGLSVQIPVKQAAIAAPVSPSLWQAMSKDTYIYFVSCGSWLSNLQIWTFDNMHWWFVRLDQLIYLRGKRKSVSFLPLEQIPLMAFTVSFWGGNACTECCITSCTD